ncbi:hypothetical protein KEM56_001542 [Ascosphaera pollenicola]|nr:hypothetical protein KEM56_001542 [Ascosphaera pollenicola]
MPSPPQKESRPEKKKPNAEPSEEARASDKRVKLGKFIRLMETVYGSFRLIENPETWMPPPMVGCHKGRYLWTDAFGVINFLTLWKETGDDRFRTLACRLILAVHDVLGCDRSGAHRLPRATKENPLAGGLRIGKEDSTGFNQDGQYLHYHCVWMFALNRTTIATDDPIWNEMAMKLGKAVMPHFWIDPKNHMRGTWWKISTDMSRNLTDSQGYIDPLDCFLVFAHMQAVSDAYGTDIHLDRLVYKFGQLCRSRTIKQHASDPLDLGMGLWTAHWLGDYEHWAYNLLRFNCRSIRMSPIKNLAL